MPEPDYERLARQHGGKPVDLVEQARNSQFAQNVVESGKQFYGDIYHALTNPRETAEAMGNLVTGTVEKMVPGHRGPLEQYPEAFGQMVADRYGSVDKAVETMYKDPVGAAADASTLLGAASLAARIPQGAATLAGMTRTADIAGKTARGLATASAVTDPIRAVGQIPGTISRAVGGPQRLYQSALKPPPGSNSTAEVRAMVETGLRENIPVSEKGMTKLWSLVDDLNTKVQDAVDAAGRRGVTVDPEAVAQRVEQLRPTLEAQVNPEKSMRLLDKSKAEFLRQHEIRAPYTQIAPNYYGQGYVPAGTGSTSIPVPIPAAEAQAIKQGTYRQLKKDYGKMKNATIEAQKALARGIREELGAAIPEIEALNAREGKLLGLSEELERAVRRGANHQMFGIGTPLAMTGMASATGSPAAGMAAGVMRGIIDNPTIKSHIANAIYRAQKLNPGRFGPARFGTALSRAEEYIQRLGEMQKQAAEGGTATAAP
jgi:hypothetical protein